MAARAEVLADWDNLWSSAEEVDAGYLSDDTVRRPAHTTGNFLVSQPEVSPRVVFADPGGGRSRRRTSFLNAVNRQLNLSPNWDGFGANRVDAGSCVRAVQTFFTAASDMTPSPGVAPTPEGGLLLEWHRGGFDIEVFTEPDGSTQIVIHEDGVEVTDSLFEASSPDTEALARLSEILKHLV